MADTPDNQAEDIDTGPLTLPQLQGLARDQIAALRNTAQGICQDVQLAFVFRLLEQIDRQLCN
jgi:hypothetical protein